MVIAVLAAGCSAAPPEAPEQPAASTWSSDTTQDPQRDDGSGQDDPGAASDNTGADDTSSDNADSDTDSDTTDPADPSPTDAPEDSDTPSPAPEAGAEPVSVTIPAIDLTSTLIPLGLQDDGTLEVPFGGDEVGWFAQGSLVGEPGPTVIAAHVDDREGPGAFAALTELQVGDEIEVATAADGPPARYRVVAASDHTKEGFPTVEVFGATRDDELRLITCTGPWDPELGSYLENRVVSAVRVDSP